MENELKRMLREDSCEADVLNGNDLIENEEVKIVQNTKGNNHNFLYPLYQRKVSLFEYEFMKTYLYALYNGTLKDIKVSISEFAALASSANPVIIAPAIVSTNELGLSLIGNDVIYVHLEYEGSKYQVTVFLQLFHRSGTSIVRNYISVLGIGPESTKTNLLSDYLINQSIKNSYYKKNLLAIKLDEDNNMEISELRIDEFKNESLDKIYVPEQIKSELERFKECADNYSEIGYSLRYLLCGAPGTGKTKSVRTLINLLYGKVTVIIAGGETDFKSLFDFARLLSPSVICIDDIDLITGNRDLGYSNSSLGSFLQELDGFEKNNVFLLATTNDKCLIDKAASRPGRFDMILDFGKIHIADYIKLINSVTKNEFVINLFDDELLGNLKRKNVTGAFIVNLIKQLEIKFKLETESDLKIYLNNLIELSYRGFYKRTEEKEFGFKLNGE